MAGSSKHPMKDWFAILGADLALDWRLWAGIVFLTAVAFVLGVYLVGFAREKNFPNSNWGFGPDWDCGDPVLPRYLFCIKKPAPEPD